MRPLLRNRGKKCEQTRVYGLPVAARPSAAPIMLHPTRCTSHAPPAAPRQPRWGRTDAPIMAYLPGRVRYGAPAMPRVGGVSDASQSATGAGHVALTALRSSRPVDLSVVLRLQPCVRRVAPAVTSSHEIRTGREIFLESRGVAGGYLVICLDRALSAAGAPLTVPSTLEGKKRRGRRPAVAPDT